jgi:hypothetical protein
LKILDNPIPMIKAQRELKLVIEMSLAPNLPEISVDNIEFKMTKNKSGVAAALIKVMTIFPISPRPEILVPKIFPTIAPKIRANII